MRFEFHCPPPGLPQHCRTARAGYGRHNCINKKVEASCTYRPFALNRRLQSYWLSKYPAWNKDVILTTINTLGAPQLNQ